MDVKRAWGLRAAWTVLIVALLTGLIFAGWQLIGSNQLGVNRAQSRLANFESTCATTPEPTLEAGNVIGVLRLPSLDERSWPIVVGVDQAQLAGGVGWYPNTAQPGAIGNTALAGYRLTNGQPFADLLQLNVGDEVIVESCRREYRYQVVVAPRDLVVDETDGWVLDGVPGEPGQLPSAKMLTLTTGQDLLPTGDRAVGFARLVAEAER